MKIESTVEDGTTTWFYLKGKKKILHREGDRPAISRKGGSLLYYKNGKLHRDGDYPAIIHPNGTMYYYKNGKLHRENGPASIEHDKKTYYLNGRIHREDGPAVEYSDGSFEYWIRGNFHRTDGPAVVRKNPFCKSVSEEWYCRGKLHREDGPAKITIDGEKRWYLYGELHRYDGPAEEGPRPLYYLHGIIFSEKDYLEITKNKSKTEISLRVYQIIMRSNWTAMGQNVRRVLLGMNGQKFRKILDFAELMVR